MTIGCSLYRFFDSDDRLLYVGVTSVGPSRWTDHEAHRAWWVAVTRTTVEHFETRADALSAEMVAILAESPIHNVVHAAARTRRSPVIRQRGMGSMVRRSDGRWQVSIMSAGRRRYWTLKTREDAELILAVLPHRAASPRARRMAAELLRDERPC